MIGIVAGLVTANAFEWFMHKHVLHEQGRDKKIRVFKYKKRKHYQRTRGHRHSYTALRIDSIVA